MICCAWYVLVGMWYGVVVGDCLLMCYGVVLCFVVICGCVVLWYKVCCAGMVWCVVV